MNKVTAYIELSKLKEKGIDVVSQIKEVAESSDVPESVIRFIESHNKTEAKIFFEGIRTRGITKNNKLYYSILDENLDEIGKLKCLSSYLTSACIAMESLDDPNKLRELRTTIGLEKVSEALFKYYNGIDYTCIDEAIKLLRNSLK